MCRVKIRSVYVERNDPVSDEQFRSFRSYFQWNLISFSRHREESFRTTIQDYQSYGKQIQRKTNVSVKIKFPKKNGVRRNQIVRPIRQRGPPS